MRPPALQAGARPRSVAGSRCVAAAYYWTKTYRRQLRALVKKLASEGSSQRGMPTTSGEGPSSGAPLPLLPSHPLGALATRSL